jgi:hypothetical protein
MAEKKVIEIDVNTKEAVKSMENLSKATHDVSASFEEVYGDLQPLTTRMGEAEDRLYELANAGKTTTKEYKDLLKTVGDYRKVQIKTDMAVDAAASTMGQKLGGALSGVASGFSVAQGVMGTFGVESEAVEGALLKVQSAMAIQQGIDGVRESIKSFKSLGDTIKATSVFQKILTGFQWLYNTALAANPVVAIVAGIAALLAIGYKLITMFQESSEANDEAAAATKRNTNALNAQIAASDKASESLRTKNGHEYNMAKASGASAEALRKLALKHADEEIALEKATLATARNTYEKEKNTLANYKSLGMTDEVIEKQRELVTKSREALKEEYTDLKQAYKNRQDIALQNQVERKEEQVQAKNDAIAAEKEKQQKIDEINAESYEKSKEALAKIKENQREATDVFKTEYELQVRAVEEKYNAEIALAKKYHKSTVDLEKAKAKELKDLEETQARDLFTGEEKLVALKAGTIAKTKELQEQEKAGLVGVAEVRQRISDAEIALEETKKKNQEDALTATAATLGNISELFGKQTAAGKAAAVAEATIQMYLSAQKAYSSTIGIPVVGPVLAPINAGLAIAAGIKNIKAITSVKVPNDPGGGNPPPATGGGGGGATPIMSANFNVVGNSGINQLGQLQQQPMKAYVVSGDVTSAQSLDRNRVENATLVQ